MGQCAYGKRASLCLTVVSYSRSEARTRASSSAQYGGAHTRTSAPRVRSRDLMTDVNVSLPPALLRGLEERAERDGLDIDEFIRQALEDTQGRTQKEGT